MGYGATITPLEAFVALCVILDGKSYIVLVS